jgi:hypothetical protein
MATSTKKPVTQEKRVLFSNQMKQTLTLTSFLDHVQSIVEEEHLGAQGAARAPRISSLTKLHQTATIVPDPKEDDNSAGRPQDGRPNLIPLRSNVKPES